MSFLQFYSVFIFPFSNGVKFTGRTNEKGVKVTGRTTGISSKNDRRTNGNGVKMTGRTNENGVRMTGRSNEKKRPRLLRSIEISANCLAAMTFSHEILTKNVEERLQLLQNYARALSHLEDKYQAGLMEYLCASVLFINHRNPILRFGTFLYMY